MTKCGSHVPRRMLDWCESKLRSGNLQLLNIKKWKNQGIFMVLIVGYILISSILTWQRVQSHQDIIKLNPLITSIFQFSMENVFFCPKSQFWRKRVENHFWTPQNQTFLGKILYFIMIVYHDSHAGSRWGHVEVTWVW